MDLPSIWKELVDAGFESGHAYGSSYASPRLPFVCEPCADAFHVELLIQERLFAPLSRVLGRLGVVTASVTQSGVSPFVDPSSYEPTYDCALDSGRHA